jgi:hypothetical protein
MKKLFVITIFFMDSLSHMTFWSLSVTGGLIIPLGDFSNTYNTAFDAGIEISYHPIPHYAFFLNSHYSFLNFRELTYNGNAGYIELGAGARRYLGKAPELYFIEAGAGYYIYYNTVSIASNTVIDRDGFGVMAGLGANMPLSPKVLLLIKTDLHFIFTSGSKTYFPGIYGGLRFIL